MTEEFINANKMKITNLLLDREEERKKDMHEKQLIKNLKAAEHEHNEYFRNEFENKQKEIITSLKLIEDSKFPSNELPTQFDAVSKQITVLQKFVSNSTLFLKEYDVRRCQEILHNLSLQAQELENKYLPKKKFGFKGKKLSKIEKPFDETDSKVSKIIKTNYLNSSEFCGFKSLHGEIIELTGDEIYKKDVTLTDLTKCIVRLFGSLSTLHINKLTDCTVLSGPVATSIFVEKCQNCNFVFACQQLRLHSSLNCNIYLHVTSRAIMEDSKDIRFAPYNLTYDNIEEDFQKSNIDCNTNHWNTIDDFNWLAVDQSPNWSIISVADRITNWNLFVQN